MRSLDWSQTRLGPVQAWPQSLRTSISICLNSAFAILVWWGPDLVLLYNDAYIPVIANKHPRALGSVGKDIFPEIWNIVGPMLEGVISRGEAVRADDLLLLLERDGYPEECYFTFSYSPILDESGGVGGIFTPVQETTERVIGARRLRTLARSAELRSEEAANGSRAAQMSAELFAENVIDIPFVAIYLFGENGTAYRAAHAGYVTDEVVPEHLGIEDFGFALTQLLQGKRVLLDSISIGVSLPVASHWGELIREVIALPLKQAGSEEAKGFMLAGINPRKRMDAAYSDFFKLVADNIATFISDTEVIQRERVRLAGLAEIDRAKTAFFSNISHEFRTPLTLIIGPLEDALLDPALPDNARRELVVAQRNSLRLQKLVNNLLEFSRLEAGRIKTAFESVDLTDLTQGLVSGFESAFAKANLTLEVKLQEIKEPVYVDPDLWEKIVLNLLSNAFKFTLSGGVSIQLKEVSGAVHFTVADSGTGIPADELPHLFERFHRIEGARGRSFEGTGIGLALVQELVKLHHGSIDVASEENVGTSFTVSIPTGTAHLPPEQMGCTRAPNLNATRLDSFVSEALSWIGNGQEGTYIAPTGPSPEAFPSLDRSGMRKRVLVADDNADMRAYLSRLLNANFDVETVADGEQAMASINRRRPDLLLSDVMMPAMDGLSMLAVLRADPKTVTLPVILLSARAGEEAEIEGLQAGADDYLVKPFSSRELLARVVSVLKIASLRAASDQSLRVSEQRFRALGLASSDVIYCISSDWREMRELDGRGFLADTLEPTTEWLQKYVPPEDFGQVMAVVLEAIAGKKIFELEHRVLRADGNVGWTFSRAIPLLDERNEITEWFGAASDVTARKEAEESLRRNAMLFRNQAEQFEAALTASATGTFRFDLETREFVEFDDNLKRLFGKTPETEFRVADDFISLVHPEDVPALIDAVEACFRGTEFSLEYRVIWGDGSIHWLYDRATVISNEGRPAYVVGACTDLTSLKKTEQELLEQRERFSFATTAAQIGYWFCNLPFDKLVFDNCVKELFWLSLDAEVTIDTFFECIHPDDRERTRLAIEESMSKNVRYDTEYRTVSNDGRQKWVHAVGRTTYDSKGHPIRFDGIKQDITMQKQSEDALRKSEKLAIVGRMAASISHEINNPLEAVTNLLYLIRAHAGSDTLRDYAVLAEEELARVSHIVTHTLQFNRTSNKTSNVRIYTLLDSAIGIYQGRLIRSGIEIIRDYRDTSLVKAHDSELRQVFSNLIGNAFDAIRQGGTITIRTRDTVNWRTGQAGLRVTIADTGHGMNADTLQRLFEPFFTTKGLNGTGLGLWVSADILKRHDATVHVRSRQTPGRSGTLFSTFFPQS